MKLQLIETKERAVASEGPIPLAKELEQVEDRLAIASKVVKRSGVGGKKSWRERRRAPQPEPR